MNEKSKQWSMKRMRRILEILWNMRKTKTHEKENNVRGWHWKWNPKHKRRGGKNLWGKLLRSRYGSESIKTWTKTQKKERKKLKGWWGTLFWCRQGFRSYAVAPHRWGRGGGGYFVGENPAGQRPSQGRTADQAGTGGVTFVQEPNNHSRHTEGYPNHNWYRTPKPGCCDLIPC